jgi:hypothetical protein
MQTEISPRQYQHDVINPPQLPEDGPIGEDLAREIVAWAKLTAPPVVAEVREWLKRQSDQEITSSPQTLQRIAKDSMSPDKQGLSLGAMFVGRGGNSAIATITLMRDGSIIWTKVRALG